MIAVAVELWPGGYYPGRAQIALLAIWNDQTGTATVGNYEYAIVTSSGGDRPPDYAGLVAQGIEPADHRGRVASIPRGDPTHLPLIAAVLADIGVYPTPTTEGTSTS